MKRGHPSVLRGIHLLPYERAHVHLQHRVWREYWTRGGRLESERGGGGTERERERAHMKARYQRQTERRAHTREGFLNCALYNSLVGLSKHAPLGSLSFTDVPSLQQPRQRLLRLLRAVDGRAGKFEDTELRLHALYCFTWSSTTVQIPWTRWTDLLLDLLK